MNCYIFMSHSQNLARPVAVCGAGHIRWTTGPKIDSELSILNTEIPSQPFNLQKPAFHYHFLCPTTPKTNPDKIGPAWEPHHVIRSEQNWAGSDFILQFGKIQPIFFSLDTVVLITTEVSTNVVGCFLRGHKQDLNCLTVEYDYNNTSTWYFDGTVVEASSS